MTERTETAAVVRLPQGLASLPPDRRDAVVRLLDHVASRLG